MKKLLGIVVLGLLWCNVVQALPVCEGSDVSKWTNCKGAYTIADGNKYEEEFKDDEFQGLGTSTFKDIISSKYGTKYVGEFKNGLPNGQGTIIYATGNINIYSIDIYVGEFKDGKRHGQGTWTRGKRRFKKGIWENDKLIEPN